MKELIKISKEVGFKSVLISDPNWWDKTGGYQLRCYLWMCELQKLLRDNYGFYISIDPSDFDIDIMDYKNYAGKQLYYSLLPTNCTTYEQALQIGLLKVCKLIK